MKKLSDMQECNGKLEEVTILRCDNNSCGQIQFAREPNSLCPDCNKGNLVVANVVIRSLDREDGILE